MGSNYQKSFFDQVNPPNKQYKRYLRYPPHNNNGQPQPPQPPTFAREMPTYPIAPGEETKAKLESFQFIEGTPSKPTRQPRAKRTVHSTTEQENEVVHLEVPKGKRSDRTASKPSFSLLHPSISGPLPSSPATRLPLVDLIGNQGGSTPSKNALPRMNSPEEHVQWQHVHSPAGSSHAVTPARRRKRARSSSPIGSSQPDLVGIALTKNTGLKTPRADPAADLWNRYAVEDSSAEAKAAAAGPPNKKPAVFSHLIREASPRSLPTSGSVSGLRRWASCGTEWPTKRRKTAEGRDEDGELPDAEADNQSGDKKSRIGSLLERMKESMYHSTEPSSSSPLPMPAARTVGIGDVSPLQKRVGRLELIREEKELKDTSDSESTVTGEPPVVESTRHVESSSDFGDDFDIDQDMLEAIEDAAVAAAAIVADRKPTEQQKPPYLEQGSLPQPRSPLKSPPLPNQVPVQKPAPPPPRPAYTDKSIQRPAHIPPPPPPPAHLIPVPSSDEFGDDDDEMFAADLVELASKFDDTPKSGRPQAPAQQQLGYSGANADGLGASAAAPVDEFDDDDEFGEDISFDEFAAAELAATQAARNRGQKPGYSEVSNRAIQRYLIKRIDETTYHDERGNFQPEKTLAVEEERTKVSRTILLRQSWFETPCTTGSYVHVIGQFDAAGRCTIDNDNGMLILHPDHLISATVVADSFGCIRRAVLQDRVKATGQASAPMFYGNVLHAVFQEALRANTWDTASMKKIIRIILPQYYETIVEIGLNLNQVNEHLWSKLPEMQGWAQMFVQSVPKPGAFVQGRNGQRFAMSINKLLDVEEHIWSPNYGLKGNVDATVQIVLNDGSSDRTLTVPLEVKTGKRSNEAHQAQTALYTLLVSDRYDLDVKDGILYYLEKSEMMRIQKIRHELIHLIMKRNELACFIRERLKLPPMLPESRQRLCNGCYAQTTCYLYHHLAEDGTSEIITNKGRFEELVRHLKPEHRTFLKKWDHLLTKEESEMMRFRRELWTMLGPEREKLGRCFSGVIIEPGMSAELPGSSKISRFQYSFVKPKAAPSFSFSESQINAGEPIVISDEDGHFALANGYVTQVSRQRVTVAVDRALHTARVRTPGFDMETNQTFVGVIEVDKTTSSLPRPSGSENSAPILYRIDKDEFSNGMATARNNILEIMNDMAYQASNLRALIVDARTPRFKASSSAFELQSQKWQSEMNTDQKAAVAKVLTAQDYALVLGMPGTGKTTTIAQIIRALVAQGKSVLLTSYTHTAVDNILLKLRNAGFDVLRLGVLAKVHPEVQEFAVLGAAQKDSLEEVKRSWHDPPVVATTCLGINHALFTQRTFDYCIVDEASQITLPVCLGPVRMARTFVLVGDHFQLPPLVQNREALEGGLDVSLFRMLSERHPDAVVNLTHQYRMCAEVMALSNELIYDGQLKCGNDGVALRSLVLRSKDAALEQHHHPPSPPSQVPPSADEFICRAPTSSSCPLARALSPSTKVVFFNTDALLPTSAEILHKSRITNPLEASITVQLAHLLIDAGLAPHDLGVITFYRSQLALLRSGLRPLAGVELHTADKFQGRDKEAVVVSFVRSNDDAGVGELLRDWRRINVALTRARSKLVLIGSKKTLLQGGEVLKGMVGICERQGWMYDLRPGAEGAHYFPGVMGTQGSSWESPAKKSPLKRKAVQDPETSPTLRKARGQGATDQAKWKKVAASSEPALSQTDLLESSIRDVLGDIEGNSSPKDRKGLKAPAKKGTVGEKALRKNKVLQDVINDLTM